MKVYVILSIYYEEDFYRNATIESVHKTLKGANMKLVKLINQEPDAEYEIELMSLRE